LKEILSRPTGELQEIPDALISAANAAGGLDNITAVVVQVTE
jgi:serine/threonine protein phosphatase PrpC